MSDFVMRLQQKNLDQAVEIGQLQATIEQQQAEIERLYQFINSLDIETMHASMDSHHQCRIRANGRKLTPDEWSIIDCARKYQEGTL
jgi:hypothetical protein